MKVKYFSIYSHCNKLRGIILLPEKINLPYKTVIVSHGFASNMMITFNYAKTFVKAGYAAVLYDFCMSSSGISGGKSTGMSILTEKENLIDVLAYIKKQNFVDKKHISLAGCSQGGLVSALVAASCEDDVDSLFLYYPALCIPDDARRGHMITAKFNPNEIPEKFRALFVKLSKKYVMDASILDPYDEICIYKKPVLIIHGIEDKLVDISYSEKAKDKYMNCTLIKVHGDHGFILKGFSASEKATLNYIKNNEIQVEVSPKD